MPPAYDRSHLDTVFTRKPDLSGSGWSSLVGIVTAIVGNVLISFALNTQRYAHIRIERDFQTQKDPRSKAARKALPKQLRNYGAAVQQEEVAEERARINAEAPGLNGSPWQNGKRKQQDEDSDSDDSTSTVGPQQDDKDGQASRKSYLKSGWWWIGIILMTVGETGNFLAYGFAPASIVSPLGVVALISNCLVAPLMLKEKFRQRDFWGVLVAIAGAVVVVLSAKTQEKKLGPDGLLRDIKRWEFLAYVLITCVFIGILMFLSPRYGQRTIMIDLGLVGLFGGYTVLSTKGVSSLLSTSLYHAFQYPIMYILLLILVVSAVAQIRYLNRALANFNSTQVIPVQFVLFTLCVIIGSAVLYRDFERTDAEHVIKFVAGCLLTFGGVYLITSGRGKSDDDDKESQEDVDDKGERIKLLDEEHDSEPTLPTKQEQDLSVDTSTLHGPRTPIRRSASSENTIPSIAVTPAGQASTGSHLNSLNTNPWISSTTHLNDMLTRNSTDRPQTPMSQILPSSTQTHSQLSSSTPFYTPHSSVRHVLNRTISSPAQPQTPSRQNRAPSPPKVTPADIEEDIGFLRQSRNSISKLMPSLPGPIMAPMASSSLSGLVADRILRGEGSPSANQRAAMLRRGRSMRESERRRRKSFVPVDEDAEASTSADAMSPLLRRQHTNQSRRKSTDSLGASNEGELGEGNSNASDTKRQRPGRLRSMSNTLSNFFTGGSSSTRRGSKDDGGGGPSGSQTDT